MNFKTWVKSIQAMDYDGACTVDKLTNSGACLLLGTNFNGLGDYYTMYIVSKSLFVHQP